MTDHDPQAVAEVERVFLQVAYELLDGDVPGELVLAGAERFARDFSEAVADMRRRFAQ